MGEGEAQIIIDARVGLPLSLRSPVKTLDLSISRCRLHDQVQLRSVVYVLGDDARAETLSTTPFTSSVSRTRRSDLPLSSALSSPMSFRALVLVPFPISGSECLLIFGETRFTKVTLDFLFPSS